MNIEIKKEIGIMMHILKGIGYTGKKIEDISLQVNHKFTQGTLVKSYSFNSDGTSQWNITEKTLKEIADVLRAILRYEVNQERVSNKNIEENNIDLDHNLDYLNKWTVYYGENNTVGKNAQEEDKDKSMNWEQLNELEIHSDFVYMITHDLKLASTRINEWIVQIEEGETEAFYILLTENKGLTLKKSIERHIHHLSLKKETRDKIKIYILSDHPIFKDPKLKNIIDIPVPLPCDILIFDLNYRKKELNSEKKDLKIRIDECRGVISLPDPYNYDKFNLSFISDTRAKELREWFLVVKEGLEEQPKILKK